MSDTDEPDFDIYIRQPRTSDTGPEAIVEQTSAARRMAEEVGYEVSNHGQFAGRRASSIPDALWPLLILLVIAAVFTAQGRPWLGLLAGMAGALLRVVYVVAGIREDA